MLEGVIEIDKAVVKVAAKEGFLGASSGLVGVVV